MRVLFFCILLTGIVARAQNAPAPKPVAPSGVPDSIPAQPGQTAGSFRIGGGVSAPVPTLKPSPEIDAADRARGVQGEVLIALVVDGNGIPQNLRIVKSLDPALDEKAMESLAKWRFKPGLKDGQPVPVQATVAVTIRLP